MAAQTNKSDMSRSQMLALKQLRKAGADALLAGDWEYLEEIATQVLAYVPSDPDAKGWLEYAGQALAARRKLMQQRAEGLKERAIASERRRKIVPLVMAACVALAVLAFAGRTFLPGTSSKTEEPTSTVLAQILTQEPTAKPAVLGGTSTPTDSADTPTT